MRAVFLIVLVAVSGIARAEPTDRSREVHTGVLVGAGALYLGLEFGLKDYLDEEQCTICAPPAIDAAARRALKWDHTRAAAAISTATGYAMAPIYALTMLYVADAGDARTRVDLALPVLESAVAVGLLHHLVKFTIGRQRPFVHHAPSGRPYDNDDNASLFSGHTGLAFSVATAAGVIAHERRYRTESAIWIGGGVIAVTTGYLRIAGDRHWLTDVALGAVVGIGFGLLIPYAFHGDTLHPAAPPTPRSTEATTIGLGWVF